MRGAALALLAVLLGGCVFRASDTPRYYRPESAALSAESPEAATATMLRLRAVRARPFLRERIVWRTESEYGMYEQRRWSELPEAYAERALASALRHTASIGLTDDTGVPALYAEVVAFDEVLAPRHVANVAIAVSLTDAKGRRMLERTFSVEAPITDASPVTVAYAIGTALDDATAQVAQAVSAALAAATPRSPAHRRRAGTRG
ncbi:MAG TPA: ABC-type transport auxiliary lipoprotein family protein [Candidatus Binatia bacterium]|jgi:ABC-type uncharacterized transport system auxiliary subunit